MSGFTPTQDVPGQGEEHVEGESTLTTNHPPTTVDVSGKPALSIEQELALLLLSQDDPPMTVTSVMRRYWEGGNVEASEILEASNIGKKLLELSRTVGALPPTLRRSALAILSKAN